MYIEYKRVKIVVFYLLAVPLSPLLLNLKKRKYMKFFTTHQYDFIVGTEPLKRKPKIVIKIVLEHIKPKALFFVMSGIILILINQLLMLPTGTARSEIHCSRNKCTYFQSLTVFFFN